MTEITLIKNRFKSSVKRGTGEAHLLIRHYPDVDFSNSIIMASLRNFAYDGQCEGSRALYLLELISLSGQQEKIRNAILKGLAAEENDTWSLTQLFDLAKMFAEKGDKDARQAIYDRFFTNPINGCDWAGYDEILELDGIQGLIFIADKIGKALENNPDDWQDGSIIGNLQQKIHDLNIMQVLEEASVNNRFIKIYLENVKRTETNASEYKREVVVYKDVVEEVIQNKISSRFYKRKWNSDELDLIARQFIIEKNKDNREKLLAMFTKFKFPLDSQLILDLAKQRSNSGNKITSIAIKALKFLKSEGIRDFALEQIFSGKNPERFIGILRSNYEAGDSKLLTDLVNKYKNENVIESLVYDYVDIYKTNKTEECREPLEALYEKSTCGIHREDIIQILMDNNILSEKIKNELKFDSNDKIRQIAEQL